MPLAETAEYSISSEVLELTCPNRFGYDNRHWVQWAWAVLARAGDVPPTVGEDDADYPRHLITIIALSHLSDVFGEVAAGVDGDLEVSVEPVGEFRPKITVIELARYCEREGIYAMEYPETDWGLVQQAVRVRTGEIARRLREILGVSRLFTALMVAGECAPDDEEREPAPSSELMLTDDAFDPAMDGVVNYDLTPDKQRAFEWLEGGPDLG
ncbi:hypothetical protein [Brachybacterium sp. UMB0905]|uniref:hypothetical protein n=1 Tax=Brachybacterium sp. UMB0905 TaxID=2069310 RepID=UPI000C80878C|nr:hypothetical protein [Brachybacterium sp. UMB0905]PMC75931.1 hypothetical protein CJ197_04465 [Brachybacterium sp. UMB0905]